jgi:hypothetical protein
MKILLNDILNIQNLENVKIRLVMRSGGFDPITIYKETPKKLIDTDLMWNYNKKKSFQTGDIVIGLAKIKSDNWLMFGVVEITKDLNINNGPGYKNSILKEYEKYFGRVVIKYHNSSQALVRKAITMINECEISKILDDLFDNDIFPGYENVNLSWEELRRVLEKDSWKTALENQKGVYLITDSQNGKMYVGSAYGKDMIGGRWGDYIKTGHGGNEDLKKLSFEYIKKYFHYSILDIFRSTVDDERIIQRESWWKDTLQTREFGYNNN